MNIEARKYHLIEQVMKFTESELNRMEAFLEELDSGIEKELTARALQSEEDIREGKIYTLEEAEARISQRLVVRS